MCMCSHIRARQCYPRIVREMLITELRQNSNTVQLVSLDCCHGGTPSLPRHISKTQEA